MSENADRELLERALAQGLLTPHDLERARATRARRATGAAGASGSATAGAGLVDTLVDLCLLTREQVASLATPSPTPQMPSGVNPITTVLPAPPFPPPPPTQIQSRAPVFPLPPAPDSDSAPAAPGDPRSISLPRPAPVSAAGDLPPAAAPAEPRLARTELLPPSAQRHGYDHAAPAPTERRPGLEPGQPFGKYRIIAELGRGGMGIVFRALDSALNQERALKVLLTGGDAGPEEVARFLREARTAARLSHPGIVPVYEVGEHAGRIFFTMELVAGRALDRVLDDPAAAGVPAVPLPRTALLPARPDGAPRRRYALVPSEAARITEAVAGAIAYAHRQRVLHRDLKPANILLAPDGRPRVTDFGLAKFLDPGTDAGLLTRSGAVMGTGPYMSPEQANGNPRAVGPRSDVYSLGALLYELLTGRAPFEGPTLEVLLAVLETEPLPPRRILESIPRDLETIALTCLEKDPARRYADADALAEDLRRWREGEPIRARPASAPARAWKWARRRPAAAALLFLAPLLALSLLAATAGPGTLLVNSDPPGAAVKLNGRATGRVTPIARLLVWPPGPAVVEIELPGYLPERHAVHVPALGSLRVPAEPRPMARATGWLTLEVTPPGARVELAAAGRAPTILETPIHARELPVGTWRATLTAPDHETLVTSIDVLSGADPERPPIRLRHETGRITVYTSYPAATLSVYPAPVDAAEGPVRPLPRHRIPTAPPLAQLSLPLAAFALDTGRYRFIFTHPDCLPWERVATVRAAAREGAGAGAGGRLALNAPLAAQLRWEVAAEAGAGFAVPPVLADLDADGRLDVVAAATNGDLSAWSGRDGHRLWSVRLAAPTVSLAEIGDLDADGRPDLIAGTGDGRLLALSGRAGTPAGEFATAGALRVAADAADLDGDGVPDAVATSSLGEVFAVSCARGRRLWSVAAGGGSANAPAVADLDGDGAAEVVTGAPAGRVVTRRGRDGAEVWAAGLAGDLAATPCPVDLDGDGILEVVVATRAGTVSALAGRTGALLWSFAAGSEIEAAPAAGDLDGDDRAEVVAVTRERKVWALAGTDGRPRWSVESAEPVRSAPALADVDGDGRADVLAWSWDGRLAALRGTDGACLWERAEARWAAAGPVARDLDGDGAAEVVAAAPTGRLAVLAGRAPRFLWSFQSGRDVESSPTLFDLDGDRRLDVLIGSYENRLYALGGRDGAPLWIAPTRSEVLAPPIVGDPDGDGRPEIAARSPGWEQVFDLDGTLLRESAADPRGGRFANRADLDGDGTPDRVADAPGPRLEATSGRDGRMLWATPEGTEATARIGLADLDGDARADALVACADGHVRAFSGKDGRELWSSAEEIVTVAEPAAADFGGHGAPDVAVGGVDGRVRALDGRTGRTLWSFETGGEVVARAATVDQDGDGLADVVVGARDGWVYALAGRSGSCLWRFPTGGEVLSAAAAGDLDGDGPMDVVVGSRDRRVWALPGGGGGTAAGVGGDRPDVARLRRALVDQAFTAGVAAAERMLTAARTAPALRGALRFEEARLRQAAGDAGGAAAALAEAVQEIPGSWEAQLAAAAVAAAAAAREEAEGPNAGAETAGAPGSEGVGGEQRALAGARLAEALRLAPERVLERVQMEAGTPAWEPRSGTVRLPAWAAVAAAARPAVAGTGSARPAQDETVATELARGAALLLTGDAAGAERLLRSAAARAPRSLAAVKLHARALLAAGPAGAAVKLLEESRALIGDFPEREEWLEKARRRAREEEGGGPGRAGEGGAGTAEGGE